MPPGIYLLVAGTSLLLFIPIPVTIFWLIPADEWADLLLLVNLLSSLTTLPLLLLLRSIRQSDARCLWTNQEHHIMAGLSGSQMLLGAGVRQLLGHGLVIIAELLFLGATFLYLKMRWWFALSEECTWIVAVTVLACVFTLGSGTLLDIALWTRPANQLHRALSGIALVVTSPAIMVMLGGLFGIPWLPHLDPGRVVTLELLSWPLRGAWVGSAWRRAVRRLEAGDL